MANIDQPPRNRTRIFGAKEPPVPQGGDVREAMRRVDQAMDDVENKTAEIAVLDPAPPASAGARERATQLISNISLHTNTQLKALRDEVDELMRDITNRREAITESIISHAEFAEHAIQAKIIIEEHIQNLRKQFADSLSPLPSRKKNGD